MKFIVASSIIATGLFVACNSSAQAPAGSTGECKDGSYTSATKKSGACSGHSGVKNWYETAPAKPAPVAVPANAQSKTPNAPEAVAPAKSPATTMAPAAQPPTAAPKNSTAPMPTTAAAGGGPGQVWVNLRSKVYHCSGDKYYGKTKRGEYMTESAAKSAGNRADHGKTCS